MKQIKMMAVLLLITIGAFAGNERPTLIAKPFTYQACTVLMNASPSGETPRPGCNITTYSVNSWNQVTIVSSQNYYGSDCPCAPQPPGPGVASISHMQKPMTKQEAIRNSIYEQQRKVQKKDKIYLEFLN